MKKILSIALVLMLMVAMFASCSSPSANDATPAPTQETKETPAPTQETKETPAPTQDNTDTAADGIVKLGLGHITSIASSKDAAEDKGPIGQVDTVMAAVGFDKDGKVVSVTIDNAQTKVNFDKDLKLASDPAAEYKTKVELGDEYGMKKNSGIGKEWYEQIAELQKWMTGKTVDEIKAMKTKEKDEKHPAVPDDPELTSLVTITVQDYIAAVEEAWANAVDVEGAVKVGLGQNIAIGKSKGADGDKGPVAQVDTVMAAAAFTADGKIAGVLIDTAQTKVNFGTDGKLASDPKAEYKTKVELGDEYGMKKNSGIGKEWYEQIAELQKWMTGKTAAEVEAMKTTDDAKPDDPELTSLVTVSVKAYIAAVVEANKNAK